MAELELSDDGSILTVNIAITFQQQGGRKQIVAPPGEDIWSQQKSKPDNTMIKALARAHRWKKLLESDAYATVDDLAKAEKINASYISRVLRLTLLAPAIVEAILDGSQSADLKLDDILKPFPVYWVEQINEFRSTN